MGGVNSAAIHHRPVWPHRSLPLVEVPMDLVSFVAGFQAGRKDEAMDPTAETIVKELDGVRPDMDDLRYMTPETHDWMDYIHGWTIGQTVFLREARIVEEKMK